MAMQLSNVSGKTVNIIDRRFYDGEINISEGYIKSIKQINNSSSYNTSLNRCSCACGKFYA